VAEQGLYRAALCSAALHVHTYTHSSKKTRPWHTLHACTPPLCTMHAARQPCQNTSQLTTLFLTALPALHVTPRHTIMPCPDHVGLKFAPRGMRTWTTRGISPPSMLHGTHVRVCGMCGAYVCVHTWVHVSHVQTSTPHLHTHVPHMPRQLFGRGRGQQQLEVTAAES
jgi:hypothetical protein